MTDDERIEVDARAREKRIYDRLRAQVASRKPGARAGALDLLLLLPDLAVLLVRLARDPAVPASSKALALLGIGWVLSPVDLLPEFLLGPLGFLDDLVVVAATLSRIVNHVHPDVVRAHWSGPGDVLDSIQKVSAWAESKLGRSFARLLGFRPVGRVADR